MYAQIVDGNILEIYSLPQTWTSPSGNTIFNFHLLSVGDIISKASIYPFEVVSVEVDNITKKLGPPSYEVRADKIVKTFEVIDIPIESTLASEKGKKANQIKDRFSKANLFGYLCPSVGIKMDCTRDDIENMTYLIAKMDDIEARVSSLPITTQEEQDAYALARAEADTLMGNITIRDYNNDYHQVTIGQIRQIRIDMIDYGLSCYQHKWQLDNMISAATTLDEINEINW